MSKKGAMTRVTEADLGCVQGAGGLRGEHFEVFTHPERTIGLTLSYAAALATDGLSIAASRGFSAQNGGAFRLTRNVHQIVSKASPNRDGALQGLGPGGKPSLP